MRKVFLDGGALDGCSTRKFLKHRNESEWKVFSFEPNPYMKEDIENLEKEFENVTFIPKAISTADEELNFIVMYTPASVKVRGDKRKNGSCSLMKEKIDWKKNQRAHDYDGYEEVTVDAIDFSRWVLENINSDDYVVLKLDIEGTEYDVLEKMIKDGSFDLIDEFYAEWHWYKVNIPKIRHDNLLEKISSYNLKKIDYTWNGSRP